MDTNLLTPRLILSLFLFFLTKYVIQQFATVDRTKKTMGLRRSARFSPMNDGGTESGW
jgi:hypothetical protein